MHLSLSLGDSLHLLPVQGGSMTCLLVSSSRSILLYLCVLTHYNMAEFIGLTPSGAVLRALVVSTQALKVRAMNFILSFLFVFFIDYKFSCKSVLNSSKLFMFVQINRYSSYYYN